MTSWGFSDLCMGICTDKIASEALSSKFVCTPTGGTSIAYSDHECKTPIASFDFKSGTCNTGSNPGPFSIRSKITCESSGIVKFEQFPIDGKEGPCEGKATIGKFGMGHCVVRSWIFL